MHQQAKINKLITNTRVGMFVTQDNGKLFSRPIAHADVDDANNIWFFTDVHSEKISDIINNQQVNFSFSNQSDSEYVSVSGTAELVKDQAIIDDKWSFFMKAWFPEGKEAERLTLIKVIPESVQYWDGSSSRVVRLFDMARALLSGKSYEDVADSENETVHF